MHVNEAEFVAELLAIDSDDPVSPGEPAELVLSNLGRSGFPVIRYRTGDLVKAVRPATGDNRFLLLEGGVLGRVDDMVVIRGVNIYPTAVEQILRSFPEIDEYRILAHRNGEMDQLSIEIEDRLSQPERVSQALQLKLGLRIEVKLAPSGSLPRFEYKGRRFVDQRHGTNSPAAR